MIRNEERSGLVFTIAGGAILLVALLAFLGFFHSSQRAPETPVHAAPRRLGGVAGEIVDARSGRTVAETNLDVRGLDGVSDHWREPDDPDHPHRFELKGLPADRDFTLEISAPGHVAERRETRATAGATTELGEIRLVPLVTLVGSVVDANFQPVADAELALARETADGSDAGPVARADAHGTFRVDGLAPGIWTLLARTSAGERCDVAARVDAHAGGETAPVEIEMFPTFTLRGRLKLPIGSAAPSAVKTGDQMAKVTGDGSFEVKELFAGPRRLSFLFGGAWRVSDRVSAPNDALELDATRLVEAAGPEPARRFGDGGAGANSSAGACTLVVRVVDEAARPLAGAFVDLVFDDGAEVTRATARNGETTFRGIKAGRAERIVGRHDGRRSFGDRDVVITERSSGTPYLLRCVPIHALVVKVATPEGTPLAHARVDVGAEHIESDATGLARFGELPPPPWTIAVAAGDAFEAWSAAAASPDTDGTVTVKLAAKPAPAGAPKPDHQ